MAKPSITRRVEFDAGHRVLGHEGKCKNLHGHRYVVEVTCVAEELDHLGRVIDFGVVKEKIGGWIESKLDHNMILNPADPLLRVKKAIVPMIGREPCIMPTQFPNPTAENIAKLIWVHSYELLKGSNVELRRVVVWETPNCRASFPE